MVEPIEASRDLWPADDRETQNLLDDFYRAAETGRTRTRETRLSADGTTVYAELTLIPFFAPDGGTPHVLAVARDITDRKRAEAARREFDGRLAQSRKMEALGQLAGGVAHDFNNILAGILGFAAVIRRSTADPAAAGFSGEIVQAATRARDLIRQILMFSRRQPAERRPVCLGEVAREAPLGCDQAESLAERAAETADDAQSVLAARGGMAGAHE